MDKRIVTDADATAVVPATEVTRLDAGKVRLGGMGPVFAPVATADAGKVRLGGMGPVFAPVATADAGKVRLGGMGPLV